MYEKRNFIMILMLVGSGVWGFYAWVFLGPEAPALLAQRIFATLLFVCLAGWLFYALTFEDKLPDHLHDVVGDVYYDVDGMSFMPTVRVRDGRAELCVFYQNRYDEPAETIVHLRPPQDSFIIRPGAVDVHFAFRAGGGDFGVIHQPIAVPRHLQGDVIYIQLAAAARYPRGHGACMRSHEGLHCGTFAVDWSGSALKTGVHEVSGEIDLTNPATIHLSMPTDVPSQSTGHEEWTQEQLKPGVKV